MVIQASNASNDSEQGASTFVMKPPTTNLRRANSAPDRHDRSHGGGGGSGLSRSAFGSFAKWVESQATSLPKGRMMELGNALRSRARKMAMKAPRGIHGTR